MKTGLCAVCMRHNVELFETGCSEKPEEKGGAIGMYHCPDCGMMLLAGVKHFRVCQSCKKELTNGENDSS